MDRNARYGCRILQAVRQLLCWGSLMLLIRLLTGLVPEKNSFSGDFNRFIIRRVTYMELKRLVERYAEFDQVAFLAFHRFDCVLEDVAAIKALTGK